jgi:hypothetical protein
MGKPVAGFLKKLVDILAALLKGKIDEKIPFDRGHGPNFGGPK